MQLPTTKVKASRKSPKNMIIYGPPKIGKTSMLAKLDNCLIIDLEDGSDMVDALKIKVRVPPDRGKANASVEKLLARKLILAPAQVTICGGHASQHKVVEIKGLTLDAVKIRLVDH